MCLKQFTWIVNEDLVIKCMRNICITVTPRNVPVLRDIILQTIHFHTAMVLWNSKKTANLELIVQTSPIFSAIKIYWRRLWRNKQIF